MSLKHKNILITGGSRGIGKAAVIEFLKAGANVFFTFAHDEKAAQEIEKYQQIYEGNACAYYLDLSDSARILNIVKKIAKNFGKIDVLVNNAGINQDKSLLFMDDTAWEQVIQINLTGMYHMTKAVIPYMLKDHNGRIINISSISGIYGLSGQVNYSASKAGMIGFTKALAKEVASYGICVNSIAPGAVQTEMLERLTEKQYNELLASVPMKRACSPQEVAKVIYFLADQELSPQYLTGQVITIDGGIGL